MKELTIHRILSLFVVPARAWVLEKLFPQHLGRLEHFFDKVEYELVPDPTKDEVIANKNLVRDLADVPVVLSAIKAKVDYIVSEDKDLSEQNETTAELRKHVTIFISGIFLRVVMGWPSERLEAVRGRKWDDLSDSDIKATWKLSHL